jgi:uridine phosphorylase
MGTGDFPRLRIGVGSPAVEIDLADFVLEPLSGDAWADLEAVVAAAAEVVEVTVSRGVVAAMDAFNRDPAPQAGPRAGEAERTDRPLPADPGTPPES